MVKEEKIIATFANERVIAPNNDLTREYYDKSRYGEPLGKTKFQYSLVEGLYLFERGKMIIKTARAASRCLIECPLRDSPRVLKISLSNFSVVFAPT